MYLCSDHFLKEDILVKNTNKCLKSGALPRIFKLTSEESQSENISPNQTIHPTVIPVDQPLTSIVNVPLLTKNTEKNTVDHVFASPSSSILKAQKRKNCSSDTSGTSNSPKKIKSVKTVFSDTSETETEIKKIFKHRRQTQKQINHQAASISTTSSGKKRKMRIITEHNYT